MRETARFRTFVGALLVLICNVAGHRAYADVIDVGSYGAVPNDSLDDTAAIQRALDAAAANSTVLLGVGSYRISGSIQPKSNTRLIGAGEGRSVLMNDRSNSKAMIDLSNVSSVELADFTLDGNQSPLTPSGVFGYNGHGHRIHHLTIQNLLEPGGSIAIFLSGDGGDRTSLHGVTDSEISDNRIVNISTQSAWGTGIRLSWGSSRNKILRNSITNTGRGGILTNDGAMDLLIKKNIVKGSGTASEKLGIEVWGQCDRSVVEDNDIDHWLSISGSNNVAVRRNTVHDAGDVSSAGFIGLELIGKDLVATDNLVDRNQHVGISISGDGGNDYYFIGFNTIQYMRTWGAQIQGDNDGAHNLYFYKNKFINTLHGQGGMYSPADGRGFRFNENVYSVVLEANTISNNQLEGLQFSGRVDRVAVIGNQITDNLAAGVTGWSGSELEWDHNEVSGNAGGDSQPQTRLFGSPKPAADFSFTNEGSPLKATFKNTSNGPFIHFLWDFGDGAPETDVNAQHVYSASGTYRVTLIGWTSAGTASRREQTITIGSIVERSILELSWPPAISRFETLDVKIPSELTVDHVEWQFDIASSPSSDATARAASHRQASTLSFATKSGAFVPAQQGLSANDYTATVSAIGLDGAVLARASRAITILDTDSSTVTAFPNPWRKGKYPTKKISFRGLTARSQIKIFSLSGHLVRKLETTGTTAEWDLSNDRGQEVASGIYLYVVTSTEQGPVKGKLAVIR